MKNRVKWSGAFWFYLKKFLMLVLCAVVLMGGAQYALSYGEMERRALTAGEDSLQLLVNTHEMILGQVDDVLESLTDTPMLLEYMNYYRNNRHNTCRAIIEQLNGAVEGSAYIDSVCVYYWRDRYTLSSDFGPAALEWYGDAAFLLELQEKDWPYNGVQQRLIQRTGDSSAARQVLTLVRTLPVFSARSPQAYLVVNLDVGAIAASMKLLSGGDTTLLVVDEYGSRIAELNTNPADYEHFAAIQTDAHGTVTVNRMRIEGEEMLVQSLHTPRGWIYHLAQPVKEMMGGISQMYNRLLLLCALVLIGSTLFSLLLSWRVYEPMRIISDRIGSAMGEETVQDGGIEQVIGRVDAVITRNTQLENERQRQAQEDCGQRFWQLARGAVMRTKRAELASALGLEPQPGVTFRLAAASGLNRDTAWLQTEINARLADTGYQAQYVFFDRNGTLLVLLRGETQEGDSTTAVQLLMQALKAYGAREIGLSAAFEDGSRLCEARHQAMKGCHAGDDAEPDGVAYALPIENDVLRAIKNRDGQAARAALNAFLLYLVQNEADAETARAFYRRLHGVIVQLTDQDVNAVPQGTLAEMDATLEALCRSTIERLQSAEQSDCSPLVQDVRAYIDANLSEELSINRLGERFFVSTSNLRRIFQAETGVTIKEYIDGRRLATAKLLLRERDLKIQEIAAQLGFRYSQSFIAFFRAAEGIPPGEYRASHLEEE